MMPVGSTPVGTVFSLGGGNVFQMGMDQKLAAQLRQNPVVSQPPFFRAQWAAPKLLEMAGEILRNRARTAMEIKEIMKELELSKREDRDKEFLQDLIWDQSVFGTSLALCLGLADAVRAKGYGKEADWMEHLFHQDLDDLKTEHPDLFQNLDVKKVKQNIRFDLAFVRRHRGRDKTPPPRIR
jgi:hypothetical protein